MRTTAFGILALDCGMVQCQLNRLSYPTEMKPRGEDGDGCLARPWMAVAGILTLSKNEESKTKILAFIKLV